MRTLMTALMLLLMTSQAHATYEASVLSDAPVYYWRLGEANKSNGQTAVNLGSTGAAGDATYFGNVGDVPDAPVPGDTAANFGTTTAGGTTGDRVQVAATAFPTSSVSVEFWLRSTSANSTMAIFSYAESQAQNNELLLFWNGAALQFFVNNGAVVTSIGAADFLDGEFHHLVVTWDDAADVAQIFIDGALADSFAFTQSPISATGTFVLGQEQDTVGGGFADNQKFIGDLDEVAIYDKVLGRDQILAHFNAASPAIPEPITATLIPLAVAPLLLRRRREA